MIIADSREEFSGRVAVVTGGGSGIGRAIAERYAAAGGKVIVVGRREEPLAETVKLITDAGGAAGYISCDVRDAAGMAEAIDGVVAREGRIDALVNNLAAALK